VPMLVLEPEPGVRWMVASCDSEEGAGRCAIVNPPSKGRLQIDVGLQVSDRSIIGVDGFSCSVRF
jgi:hypothetical protein